MSLTRTRVPAVLETSFWVLAYRAEIAAICFDVFDITVLAAVEAEITSVPTSGSTREYPYAALFRVLRNRFHKADTDVPPLPGFGRGEAEAIAAAAKSDALLLINESRAARYARNMGVDVASVPSAIVLLRSQNLLSDRAARTKLKLIASNTAAAILKDAVQALDLLGSDA